MNHTLALADLQGPMVIYGTGSAASGPLPVMLGGSLLLGVVALVALILLVRAVLRHHQRRLDLLQEALRNPNLSPQAQVELVRTLKTNAPRRWLFSLGWLGLFGGIGWLCTDPRSDELTAAIIVTVTSFAFITLPIALRELDARSA